MRKSHELLLRLWHDPAFEFRDVRMTYLNRGAPQDRTAVDGGKISRLDSQYIEIETEPGAPPTCIPYHRLRQIEYRGVILWEYTEAS